MSSPEKRDIAESQSGHEEVVSRRWTRVTAKADRRPMTSTLVHDVASDPPRSRNVHPLPMDTGQAELTSTLIEATRVLKSALLEHSTVPD